MPKTIKKKRQTRWPGKSQFERRRGWERNYLHFYGFFELAKGFRHERRTAMGVEDKFIQLSISIPFFVTFLKDVCNRNGVDYPIHSGLTTSLCQKYPTPFYSHIHVPYDHYPEPGRYPMFHRKRNQITSITQYFFSLVSQKPINLHRRHKEGSVRE